MGFWGAGALDVDFFSVTALARQSLLPENVTRIGFRHWPCNGNPMGGYLTLRCFVNGSLAREAVRDRFQYGWDAFSLALKRTPSGNRGQLMLSFWRPEIGGRVAKEGFILKGTAAFERWEDADAAIRACVEGQFLLMYHYSRWMHLSSTSILLTGGASRDDALAQVLADIFQTPVQRMNGTASVAIGAALRAGHFCMGIPLSTLEAYFCRTDTKACLHIPTHRPFGRIFAHFRCPRLADVLHRLGSKPEKWHQNQPARTRFEFEDTP